METTQKKPRRAINLMRRAARSERDRYGKESLQVVFDFAAADLESLRPAGLARLARNVWTFGNGSYVFQLPNTNPHFPVSISLCEPWLFIDPARAETPADRIALSERLGCLQQQVRAALDPTDPDPTNESDGYQQTTVPVRVKSLRFYKQPQQSSSGITSSLVVDDFESAFWIRFAELLHAYGDHVQTCASESCNQRFVRHRKQEYCSAACSQRDRSKRSYEKHRVSRVRQARRRRRLLATRGDAKTAQVTAPTKPGRQASR